MDTTDNPLNILHVCSIKGRGGTGYMAGHLIRLLHEAGHHVHVAACGGSKIEERAKEQGLSFLPGLKLRRGLRPLSLLHDVMALRRWVREKNIDIIHAWHSIEYWSCFLATLGTGVKLARTRGIVTPVRAHLFNRMIHTNTAALFATCEKIKQNYGEAGFRMDNVFMLRDGVDTYRFCPGTDTLGVRHLFSVPAGAFLIGNIGRLEPVKGQHTLLHALKDLPEHVHALFIGGGSREQELKHLAQQLGVDNRAHFAGVQSNVECWLQACDAYVLCSVGSEGSSRATLEAMATRLPCITTTVGMLPDIVVEERTGLLYEPEDHATLSKQILRLANDEALRTLIAEHAYQMVLKDWSEEAMVKYVEAVYRQILADAEPGEPQASS